MVAEELVKNGYKRTWICGYRRTWNKIVTEELRIQWLQIFDQNGYRRTGKKWLRKNSKYNGYRRNWNKIVTEKLRTRWSQVLDQNGYRRTGSRMVTKELGYVDTEELGIKSLQKNSEYNVYKSSIKMVTEELGKNGYGKTLNTMVIEKNGTKLLQRNLEHGGYRSWIKTATEELGAEWLQTNLEHNDKRISGTKTITELGTKMLWTVTVNRRSCPASNLPKESPQQHTAKFHIQTSESNSTDKTFTNTKINKQQ
jgi:hypothetical protein